MATDRRTLESYKTNGVSPITTSRAKWSQIGDGSTYLVEEALGKYGIDRELITAGFHYGGRYCLPFDRTPLTRSATDQLLKLAASAIWRSQKSGSDWPYFYCATRSFPQNELPKGYLLTSCQDLLAHLGDDDDEIIRNLLHNLELLRKDTSAFLIPLLTIDKFKLQMRASQSLPPYLLHSCAEEKALRIYERMWRDGLIDITEQVDGCTLTLTRSGKASLRVQPKRKAIEPTPVYDKNLHQALRNFCRALRKVNHDGELVRDLLRRADEVQKCVGVKARIATVILLGSIQEAILQLFLESHPALWKSVQQKSNGKHGPTIKEMLGALQRLNCIQMPVDFIWALHGLRHSVHATSTLNATNMRTIRRDHDLWLVSLTALVNELADALPSLSSAEAVASDTNDSMPPTGVKGSPLRP